MQNFATAGNCITPTVYYYSCSCGAVGTSTFHGSLDLDTHIGDPRIEYQAFDANHNVLSYCSSCNVLISTVPEAHNMVNEECTLCHKVIHNHNYNLELVSEAAKASSATCTAKATYYYSCQCGALSTDTFEYGEVRAHTFTGNSTQYKASDATCSVRATYYKTCSSCGIQGSETFESGLADGPHPGTTVPTYVKLNETQHTKKNICTACSNEVSSSAENHTFNENNTCSLCDEHVHNYTVKHVDDKHLATPASCTAAAKYYYSCTCDDNGTETFENGVALSHNEAGKIVEDKYFKSDATCLTPTTYYKSCTGCGLKGTDTFTVGQALGHIEQIVSGYAATCTTTGLTDGVTCSRCNEIVKMQVIINALGHKEIITTGKEATCTTSGTTDKITCSRCNTVITNSTTIPALGHDIVYDDGYAATCSMPGLTTGERCSRCDYKVTQQEIAKLPHTEVIDNAVSVTCTTNGYTEGKHCSVCGEVTIPQETIPAIGHAEVKLNAIAATCTSSGLTEGSQCSKCGSVLKAQISIAAKGHTVVQDSAVAATCTNEGRTAGSHCSVCSVIISGTSTIAKLEHDYDVEITNPQCVVPGSITYTCKLCGHTYDEYLDSMGHIDTDNNSVCDICDANISKHSFALSGKWILNYEIPHGNVGLSQDIGFVVNNITCNKIEFTQTSMYYHAVDGNRLRVATDGGGAYDESMWFWNDWENYSILNFGSEPQEVSQEFYEWFIANATPYEESVYALSGKWLWNDDVNKVDISQSITFTNCDTEYDQISMYKLPEEDAKMYVIDYSGFYTYMDTWISEEYKIVDFGTESQEVSKEFYEWFIANASPYEEETYELSGTWLWNDDAFYDISEEMTIVQSINFTVGDSEYSSMDYERRLYSEDGKSGYINMLYYDSDIVLTFGYVDAIFDEVIDFGSELQEVSKEFYDWFMANAIPEPVYELSGEWVFNNEIRPTTGYISQDINFVSVGQSLSNISYYPVHSFDKNGDLTTYVGSSSSKTGKAFIRYDDNDRCSITYTNNVFSGNVKCYWNIDSEENTNLKNVDFGDTAQTVSKEFYEWFVINATPANNSACGHEVTETIVKEATCSQTGLKLIVCPTCKTSNYTAIDKVPHTVIAIEAVPATCLTNGSSAGEQCSICNAYIVKPSTIAKFGHDFVTDSITNATCTTDGISVNTCLRCNETITTTLAATGHIDDVEDGICDLCGEIIEYIMYIGDQEYKFTYNMTWGEWFASKYNTTDLIQVGNSFIKINDDGKTGYKLTAIKTVFENNKYSIYVSTPQKNERVFEDKYQLAKITFNGPTVVTSDGVFSTDFDTLGIETYIDMANKLKDGSLYAVINNGNVFYTYDDVTVQATIRIYVNNQWLKTHNKTYCIINGSQTVTLDFGTDGKWYLADKDGNPTGEAFSTGPSYIFTEDINVVYMATYAPELTFYDLGVDAILPNADIELYNATTGQLINKFKTNNNGVATIAGLTAGEYICKSKYQTYTIILNGDGFTKELNDDSKLWIISLTASTTGQTHIYDADGNFINSVDIVDNKVKVYLVPGVYQIQVNDQEQRQILTLNIDGTIDISPLQ